MTHLRIFQPGQAVPISEFFLPEFKRMTNFDGHEGGSKLPSGNCVPSASLEDVWLRHYRLLCRRITRQSTLCLVAVGATVILYSCMAVHYTFVPNAVRDRPFEFYGGGGRGGTGGKMFWAWICFSLTTRSCFFILIFTPPPPPPHTHTR